RQVRVGQRLFVEEIDAAGQTIAEQIRLDERQLNAARVLTVLHGHTAQLAAAEQVAFGHADFGEETVGCRIATANGEFSGRYFFHIDVHDDTVGRRAGLAGDLDRFEEIEVFQPALGAVDQRLIVGIALADIELAADHIIAGTRIAANIDALDVGAHALLDHESKIDDLCFSITVATRMHGRESVAALRGFDRHRFDALLDQVGVINIAGAQTRLRPQDTRIDRLHVGDHVHGTDMVLRTLVDGVRDGEAFFARVVLTDRRDDSHVGITVAQIEFPQQIAIGFNAVGIVDVGGLKKAQPVALTRLDDVLEAP